MFPFERLQVFQRSMDYAEAIYEATASFPDFERYGLRTQLQRAAASVFSNIAEGACCETPKAKLKYFQDAYGSLMETVAQLLFCQRRGFVPAATYRQLYAQAEEISRMLSGLRRSVRNQNQ